MSNSVEIVFLGGLGSIGRNCMALKKAGEILIIDCGIMFPKEHADKGRGVIIPDFSWFDQDAQIVGAVLTHGHEDHLGALPMLMRKYSFPVYGSSLSLGILAGKLKRDKSHADLIKVNDFSRVQIGNFDVEFIPVTHSVPSAHAVVVHSPTGAIVHSGDFKLDMTPVDKRLTGLSRLGEIASTTGIDLLMLDSTNAAEKGFAQSESAVGEVLDNIFNKYKDKRIIIATFASHIHRIQQIVNTATSQGRVILPLGRAMTNNIELAMSLGLLHIDAKSIVKASQVDLYMPENICIIATGSQGEPTAALTMIAKGEHKDVDISPSDAIILSSNTIPGNELEVAKTIEAVLRRGAIVVHSGISDVHATGHAQSEDLKIYLSIANPRWFVPIHGEYIHMHANRNIGIIMGVPPNRALLCADGDALRLKEGTLSKESTLSRCKSVSAKYVFVDQTRNQKSSKQNNHAYKH
jgi:ribonuclease J